MKAIVAAALVLQSFTLSACGFVYTAEPITAWVVDEETGKPIEGVHVVVEWQLRRGGLDGSIPVGPLVLAETQTDVTGMFEFPAWGPKVAISSRLESSEPAIYLLKAGYLPRSVSNRYESKGEDRVTLNSEWSGRKIALARRLGDTEKWVLFLEGFGGRLSSVLGSRRECRWREIPHMLAAYERERQAIEASNSRSAGTLVRIEDFLDPVGCGSMDEFRQRYMK